MHVRWEFNVTLLFYETDYLHSVASDISDILTIIHEFSRIFSKHLKLFVIEDAKSFCDFFFIFPCLLFLLLDINECQSNPCGVNATCIDTQGSYSCVCKEHYTGDPYQACSDIDECKALDKPCGLRAICENTVPGFNCLCPKGYSGKPDAKVACEQVSWICSS
ncbi:complement component C1q receptor-like [Diaphorina citri]|uniref:Complement component C1q receptor-like n=1 Tax=Diaphorina citri TaxID=121845 RepID=A0A3Q0J5K7_DIACI|nr:complement component C1q receptor-like [Diaphorina citri]